MRFKTAGLVLLSLAILSCLVGFRLLVPGASFLLRYQDPITDEAAPKVTETVITRVPPQIPVRVYEPAHSSSKTVLLVHGVHYLGFEEPRLLHFARTLVSLGFTVVVPDIGDLRNYSLTPRAIDEIEHSALWILEDAGLVAPGKQIGIYGISFSGGLSIAAAARDSLRGRVSSVFSFGGHGDLDETLEYLLTGVMPDGTKMPAHIYGGAVVARWFADRLVPRTQVETLRGELLEYLSDKGGQVRARVDALPPESQAIVKLCLARDDVTLGSFLKERLGDHSMPRALSPVRGPVPGARIFLLHGSADDVIPPSETARLAAWAQRETDVTVLVSDLIQHVEFGDNGEAPTWMEYWRIIRFWTELLRS